uniref:Uncharacterized protein n=1 Tax=Arundo donax TaxID=35708 RepID=A0A0A9B9Z5_ARUDO
MGTSWKRRLPGSLLTRELALAGSKALRILPFGSLIFPTLPLLLG